jgi:hypothetical protein
MKPLKDFHSIPVRIRIVDKIGKSEQEKKGYRRRAYVELKTLYSQMFYSDLQQSGRTVGIDDNVYVKCYINHSIKNAVVVIGDKEKLDVHDEVCWCCGPCLVAGTIIKISGGANTPYADDTKYYASIKVCQKPDPSQKTKKRVEVTSRTSGSSKAPDIVNYKQTNTFIVSETLENIPITDRFRHKVGTTVLVLVSPLYKFVPQRYNPCINKRALAQDGFTKLTITTAFLNSTGQACSIMRDKYVWLPDPKDETRVFYPEAQPFRILPIQLSTCLTGMLNE